jgi:hypothetical protein
VGIWFGGLESPIPVSKNTKPESGLIFAKKKI